ncbi:UDP-N-acetyl-D-galactosamine dehydrogenase [Mucilaginibacter sp. UYP25]|uniref:nucleotide sugar dehydrogenase n=1 Tax=Mucilaginibacter sp. UYP27 TaxID=1756391 RepID=UPI0033995FE9
MFVPTEDIDSTKPLKIAVIGLGYVGLPLAIEFGKKYQVTGYDINEARIRALIGGYDSTLEAEANILNIINDKGFNEGFRLAFTNNVSDIQDCNVFIITVPTPLDQFKSPDLTQLKEASKIVGKALKANDLVIYESTVYPGCTEDDCVPVLVENSGLIYNRDFFCGYSPERINPGDKINTLTNIKKVTSGSTPEAADIVDKLYNSIITAGTHKAPSIKVAEASKAIENAQRDINISFINELALIFDRMGIDTTDVLEAAGTKWNFLKYKPGLVGGHCIGVDPYYLAHKAESLGYHPQVILSGRRINDNMGVFIANKVIKLLIKKNHNVKNAKTLILGITFKENCPDIRNTRVIDIYNELIQLGMSVDVFDPWANAQEVKEQYDIKLIDNISKTYDAVILAVAHTQFTKIDFSSIKNANAVIFDIKSVLPRDIIDGRL